VRENGRGCGEGRARVFLATDRRAAALIPLSFSLPQTITHHHTQLCDLVPPPPPPPPAPPGSEAGGGGGGASGSGSGGAATARQPQPSATGRNGIERPKHAILADTIAELKDLRAR
jgi:hypothetical protein